MKDKIGIFTSLLCMIHCIAFPLLFSMLPVLKLVDEKFEWSMLVTAFLVGILSFYDNYRRHKYLRSISMFIIAFISISIGMVIEMEIFNIIGLVLLIIAHYSNYKFIRKRDGCHPHSCKHK